MSIEILRNIMYLISFLFYKVLYLSITGSLVGITVLILKKVFNKKISAKWKCILWYIVILSLLISVKFEIKTDKINFQNNLISKVENIQNIPEYIGGSTLKSDTQKANLKSTDSDINLKKEDNKKQLEEFEVNIENDSNVDFNLNINSDSNELILNSGNINQVFNKENIKDLGVNTTIPLIWILGSIYFEFLFLNGIIRFNKKISRQNYTEKRIHNILNKTKEAMEIKKKIRIILQKDRRIPSIYGVINPAILITKETLEEDENTIKYIFMHELAHYKRKDTLLNYVLLLILSIHWFNPIVWFIYKKIRQDIELGTDELVLEKLNKSEKIEYGMVLIKTLENIGKDGRNPSLLCISDDSKNMERRIHMIKEKSKSKIISAIFVIVIIGIIAGIVFVKLTVSSSEEVITTGEIKKSSTQEKIEYEKVWQEPSKFSSFSEYNDFYKSQQEDILKVTEITEEDRKKVISEYEAEKIASDTLSAIGYENPYIGKAELKKNYSEVSQLVYVIKANDSLELTINAETGEFVFFTDNGFKYISHKQEELTQEQVKSISDDLFKKLNFDENYKFGNAKEEDYFFEQIGNKSWGVKYYKNLNNNIINQYDFISFVFLIENGEIKIDTISKRNILNTLYNKTTVENNPIVITEEEAIDIAKNKDKEIFGIDSNVSEKVLTMNCMNCVIWYKEQGIPPEEQIESEEIIDENGNKVTHGYSKYYFPERIVRNSYSIRLSSEKERDKNSFRDKDLVYFVDATTGEIIGGTYSSGESILY